LGKKSGKRCGGDLKKRSAVEVDWLREIKHLKDLKVLEVVSLKTIQERFEAYRSADVGLAAWGSRT